jgi:uncharacterized membrane protein
MDPEVKKMMEENLALARENNTILKGIRGAQRRAMIYRFLYWILILGITFGAYYFVQPYVDSLLGYYGSFTEGVDSVNKASSMSDLKQVKDLLQQLNQ